MSTKTLRILPIIITLFAVACGPTKYPTAGYTPTAPSSLHPRYDQLYYWAAHPWKQDLSDSTPAPYRTQEKDSSVDVFFIHPTIFTDKNEIKDKPYTTAYWNASINDESLNAKTDFTSMLNQASTFNKYRVFAPRYRQAHLESFSLPDSISAEFFDTAYTDVRNAFEYYLAHYNGGRPFIIASHSQGTLHAGRLIKEMIEGKPLQNSMVAAYIIGLAVPEHYFTTCKPCSTPLQTGCFLSWRTYKKGYVPAWIEKESFKSIVVNPVTWTMDTLLVPRQAQKGSVLYNFNAPIEKNVSTQVHGNLLWSSKPRFFGNIFFTRKNYHIGDINLFWKDIRDNVDDRVHAFGK